MRRPSSMAFIWSSDGRRSNRLAASSTFGNSFRSPAVFTKISGKPSFQRAAWAERLLPVVRVTEGMHLDEIDVVDVQPIERAMQIVTSALRAALAGLGGEKEIVPVPSHPRRDTKLRVSVPRRGVDVI